MTIQSKAAAFFFATLLSAGSISGQSTLVLKNAFIEKYKNRVTVDATYSIDHAHPRPNPVGKGAADGDLHFSGRSEEIGLPLVAEIINAKLPSQKKAVDFVHQEEGTGTKIALTGVWRIWFEHPPAQHGTQVQGDPVPVPGKAGYNYAEFSIVLEGQLLKVDDGFIVLANVVDEDGNPIISGPRRMIFLGGTPAAAAVQKLKKGDTMHVMGIPRVNLERISFAMQESGGSPVTIALPYEMIIIGAFPD